MKYIKVILFLSVGLAIIFFIYYTPKIYGKYTTYKREKELRINFPREIEYVEKIPTSDSLYIFIMAGQSNMAGLGFVKPLDTIPNKRILTINKSTNWIYAKEPLHFYEPSIRGLDCGVSFAKNLIDSIPEGVSIAMIPCAVQASSIEQWLNNETLHGVTLLDNFKSKVEFAKKYGKIKGILWHQGESNATSELIPTYSQKLESLIKVFRKTVNNDSLLILIGELGNFAEPKEKRDRWDSINYIIHDIAKNDNIAVVVTNDFKHIGDKVHFDAESQRKLGERFAIKYLELTMPTYNNTRTK